MLLQASAYLQDSRPKPLYENGEILSDGVGQSPLLLKASTLMKNVSAQ
jgi:hypothetical protein